MESEQIAILKPFANNVFAHAHGRLIRWRLTALPAAGTAVSASA
jgi:hypothetical protein